MKTSLREKIIRIVLAVTLSSAAGCGGDYNAEKAYWQMNRYHSETIKNPKTADENEFTRTISELKKIVRKYPLWEISPKIQYQIGEMYASREEYGNAREELMKAVMNFPEYPNRCARARFLMGVLMEKQGKFEDALEDYTQLEEQYPVTFTGLQLPLYLAQYYSRQGLKEKAHKEYKKAVRNYRNTIEMNPYSKRVPVLQYLMMIAYGNENKWVDLIEDLHDLAERYPESRATPVALYRIAEVYRVIFKELKKAEFYYNKITAEHSGSDLEKMAQYAVGGLSLKEGNIEKAREEFDKIKQMYPDDTAMNASNQFAVALGYEKSGRWEKALKEYSNVEKEYPWTIESLRSVLAIALYYQREGQAVDAEYAFKNVIRKCDEVIKKNINRYISVVAQDYKTLVYITQKKWDKALEEINKLLTEYPEDPRASVALFNKAVIYDIELNESAKALELYNTFIQKYSEHELASRAREKIKRI